MKKVKALVLTGYGMNCDYETDYALKVAGAESHRVHINELIKGEEIGHLEVLKDYHILVFDLQEHLLTRRHFYQHGLRRQLQQVNHACLAYFGYESAGR